jgi:hypothetical protein
MYSIEEGISLITADPNLFVIAALGTCFTFAPAGIGLFATFVPPLACWQFHLIGAICVVCAARAVWQCYKLPKSEAPKSVIEKKSAA